MASRRSTGAALRCRLLLDGIDLTPDVSAADEACDLDVWGWSYGVRLSERAPGSPVSPLRGHQA